MSAPTARPTTAVGRGPLLRSAAPALGVGLLAAGTFLLVRTALVDDAYITLAYARNVALHGTWGLLSDVPSNTATSPLWVLVLSAVTSLVRRPVLALGLLHVAVAVACTLALSAAARRTGLPRWTGPAAAVALGVNPLLLSSTGLESAFLVLLLALLLAAGTAGRPVVFGLLAGAVVLTRMDAGVSVAVLSLLLPAVLRRLHLAVLAALAVVLPWTAWSWWFLGSAVPDTVVIKTLQSSWGRFDVGNGALLYADVYGGPAVLAFLPLVLGGLGWCVLLATTRRAPAGPGAGTGAGAAPAAVRTGPWLAFGAAGLAHYAALSLLHVPPYHWYFAVLVATSTVVMVAAVGVVATVVPARPVAAGAGLAAGLLVLASAVVVVRAGTPWPVAPVQSNFAEPRQYDVVAAGVAALLAREDGPRRVESPGEIGHLAFACDCVVDQFADPARLEPSIAQVQREASPGLRRLLELNFTHRDRDAAPVPVEQRLFRYDRGTEPPGLPSWPVSSTWDVPPSTLVLQPLDQTAARPTARPTDVRSTW